MMRLKLATYTAADWQTANPILLAGEIGVEADTKKIKVGDGSTAWNELPYIGGSDIYGRLAILEMTPYAETEAF